MERIQVLKAVAIFFVSLGVAVIVGFSLGALAPPEACTFPVVFDRTSTEAGVQVRVTHVEGSYLLTVIGYKAIVQDTEGGRIIQEGNLTDLSPGTPGLSFHPMDANTAFLQAGDLFQMNVEGEVHLILLDEGGTPIGWTLGCEI